MQKWVFLLGDIGICGGLNVIFEHALYALDRGNIVMLASRRKLSPEMAKWHKGTERFQYVTLEECQGEEFDVAIATGWTTTYDVSMVEARKYIYFVQSIESRFYYSPRCEMAALADLTYEMPFAYVTEATWIQRYLKREFSQDAKLVRNGINKQLFCEDGERYADREAGRLRVLVEGPINSNIKNVSKTIEICKRSEADEIWLLTSSIVDTYEGVDKVFSRLPIEEVAKVYRSCDVLVKLSLVEGMFGPPLEMFHCGGTAITYSITGSEEYIVHGKNALVAEVGDEARVLQYINSLKHDSILLEKMKMGALKTAASWISWDNSSKKFYEVVNSITDIEKESKDMVQRRATRFYGVLEEMVEKRGVEPSRESVKQVVQLISEKQLGLVIYGAGATTRGLLYLLDEYKIPLYGIAVTDTKNNPQAIFGNKVSLITDFLEKRDEILVYISTNKYRKEIEDVLRKYGFVNII